MYLSVSFTQWDSSHIYLITEYCNGGDLCNFIRSRKRLSEVQAKHFLQQLGIYSIYIVCTYVCYHITNTVVLSTYIGVAMVLSIIQYILKIQISLNLTTGMDRPHQNTHSIK